MSKDLLEAFRDTAIKCHIGFKHEGPWENCGWIECEDRRKMIDAASLQPPSPQSDKDRAREIIGNVNNYAEEHNSELSISAFGPIAERIASALTTAQQRGAELQREADLEIVRNVEERDPESNTWRTDAISAIRTTKLSPPSETNSTSREN